MKLQVHDDKKEKWQSFEARILNDSGDVVVESFGRNSEDAISNLKKDIKEKIMIMRSEISELEAIDLDQLKDSDSTS